MLGPIITKIRNSLEWQFIEVYEPPIEMEIVSDPWCRTHTLYLPPTGDDFRTIEYLHELAHAYLAETIHPLLSTAYFVKGVTEASTTPFLIPFRTAADWFADQLLMKWCPNEERREIQEHAAVFVAAPLADDQFNLFGAGLMFAQAIQYRVKHPPPPKEIKPIIDIFRGIRPGNPSLRNMRRLINRLAAQTTTHQLIAVQEDNADVWGIE